MIDIDDRESIVADAVERHTECGESWTFQVVGTTVEVALTEQVRCSRCGEEVTVSGPVYSFDRIGRHDGAWSQQHGCGGWDEPHHLIRYDVAVLEAYLVDFVDEEDDEEDAEEAAVYRLEEAIDEVIGGMMNEVRWDREVAVDREVARIERRLERELDAAIESGESTGSDQEPGAYQSRDGSWVAWDDHPDGSDEIIEIHRSVATS